MSEVATATPTPSAEVASEGNVHEKVQGTAQERKDEWDKKFKLKSGDVEYELDLNDPKTRDNVFRRLNKEFHVEKEMQNISETKKREEKIKGLLSQKKFVDALMELGLSKTEAYEQLERDYYESKKFEMLPEEERKKIAAQREAEELEKKNKEIREEIERQEWAKLQEQSTKIMADGVHEMIQKFIPDATHDDYINVLREFIEYEEMGDPRSMEEVVKMHKAGKSVYSKQSTEAFLRTMPVEQLIKLSGREADFQKYFLDKVGNKKSPTVNKVDAIPDVKDKKYISTSDFRSMVASRVK